jgi:TonB family protein
MPKAAAVEVVPPNVETAEEPASSRSATLASAPASLTVAPDLSELRAAILSKHEEPVNAKQPEVLCAAENLGTPVKPKPAKPVRVAAPAVPVNFIELEKMQSPAERPRAPFLIAASVVVVLFAAVGVHFYGGLHRASATEPISLSAPITPAPGAAPLASPAEPTPDNTKVQVPPKSTTQPSPVAAQAPQSKLAPQFQPQVITPPVTVMELAPSQPKPKAEVAENLEAPALESGGSGLPSLPAAAAAMPNISVQKSSVVPAELIQRVAPVYPLAARSLGVKGTVSLVATISVTGEVSAVRVVSGDQVLRQAAVDAVKRWRYRPATLNGAPTESTAEVTLNFTSPR